VVSPDGSATVGKDNAMAWFPADSPFGSECISAILTETGAGGPADHPIGWIQVHRDHVIWIGWEGNNVGIDWGVVQCLGTRLFGTDQRGTRWSIAFNIWYAGFPPAWPDWLLDD
jgi:hypothetical protein